MCDRDESGECIGRISHPNQREGTYRGIMGDPKHYKDQGRMVLFPHQSTNPNASKEKKYSANAHTHINPTKSKERNKNPSKKNVLVSRHFCKCPMNAFPSNESTFTH
mmetsp:Transcript_6594/g.24698  ORF Transcript_6594/g.24698 Transcript_6594/m.24698 type:complete len:107 (+) Transcript_6594:2514-2834(+)